MLYQNCRLEIILLPIFVILCDYASETFLTYELEINVVIGHKVYIHYRR
jgi:hypothetical protein